MHVHGTDDPVRPNRSMRLIDCGSLGTEREKCGGHWRYLFFSSPRTISFPTAMHTSPASDPMSIFVDGKLKSGVYKVQNLASQTYLEVLDHSKELCCRIAAVLTPKDALVIRNAPPIIERIVFLMLNSGTFKHGSRDIRSKRCVRTA